MFMTASRSKVEGKPLLKLNIHEYEAIDLPFLDSLGITTVDETLPNCKYISIHSQEDFLGTRSALLDKYTVVEEKGPKVFLKRK